MFRRTLLKSRPRIIWRPHRINFHRNMQNLPDLQQQGIAADGSLNHSGGQASTATHDKTQDQTDSLLLNQPKGNSLTNHGYSHDINIITVKEMSRESRLQILECHSPSFKKQLDDLESRLQILKCHSPFLRKELDDIELSRHKLNAVIKKLEKYRDREYAGGVVCIRNRLAKMFLSSAQNAQRKQQIANPIDVRVNVCDQNALAYDVNLSTTINQADMHPDYFDICLDTVFGAPKDLINDLLKWDKTGEYQVYSILGDHGEAWHKGFANTCPNPFKTWLSSTVCLQKYETAISHDKSSDLESLIQNQKEQVKKSIQEWHSSYATDRSNYGKKRKECQKIIKEDYRDRGLITRIRENLFHGVNLD
ncbi:hypothetical protein BGAL_0202g00130 [Botrytis galanthina]|uniref:Uncharacterized protein n=1 Tax=Botrytis galanthina TaxID=278940 RepID=A0A4S8R7R4_9HELO|nr:hypothetical protein BGAL_0202g00130 [Botrytis galanthina]